MPTTSIFQEQTIASGPLIAKIKVPASPWGVHWIRIIPIIARPPLSILQAYSPIVVEDEAAV